MSDNDYNHNSTSNDQSESDFEFNAATMPADTIRRSLDEMSETEYIAQLNARNKAYQAAVASTGDATVTLPDIDVWDYVNNISYHDLEQLASAFDGQQAQFDPSDTQPFCSASSSLDETTGLSEEFLAIDVDFLQSLNCLGYDLSKPEIDYNVPPLEVNDQGQAVGFMPPQIYPEPYYYDNIPSVILTGPEGGVSELEAPSDVTTPRYYSIEEYINLWCYANVDYSTPLVAESSSNHTSPEINIPVLVESTLTNNMDIESRKRKRDDEDQGEGRVAM